MTRKRLRHPGHWLPRHVVNPHIQTYTQVDERLARRDRLRQIRQRYYRAINDGVTQPFSRPVLRSLSNYRRHHRSAFRRSPRVAWYLRATRAIRDGSANDMNYRRVEALESLPEDIQGHIYSYMRNPIERDLDHALVIHSGRTGYR